MKIKHNEIEIPKDQPFLHCKLGRVQHANVLYNIINNYSDGFVLAINNEWGTGKTTFVKMWQQMLINDNFQTIYFNAWENDFDNNPLIAIMSELKTLIGEDEDKQKIFKSILQKRSILLKNILPTLIKSLFDKYVCDSKEILEVVENVTKASTEILEEGVKEYCYKKETILEFKKELEKFVKQPCNNKPLVFIIDELDRCRPTYSVEVLEQIKHFFSVQGIIFVLSIDKKHLGSAIKGFYGSEQINSDEYLRRFIDLEYSIPAPSPELFNKYLFSQLEYYQFEDFFSSCVDKSNSNTSSYKDYFLYITDILFTQQNITLRQQEKIFALTRLVVGSLSNRYKHTDLIFLLVYLKIMRNDIFQKIERKKLSVQELSDLFCNTVLSAEKATENHSILRWMEYKLLELYNDDRDEKNKEKLFTKDASGITTPIKSKLQVGRTDRGISLAECFEKGLVYDKSERHWFFGELIDGINLTQSFAIK